MEQLAAILDVLRDNERRGRISVVHCRGGIGRTGMVVGCWLVEGGVAQDGNEALSYIAREWRTVQKAIRYPHRLVFFSLYDPYILIYPFTLVQRLVLSTNTL